MNILLIGNYRIDRQQSMQLFCDMLEQGIARRGHAVRVARPEPLAGKLAPGAHGAGKWLGYIDKFMLFPPRMHADLRWADVVHICDHSNAFYTRYLADKPSVVTCHDLLAVRGALGEETDCPASYTGKILQKWILNGLLDASVVVCVSSATQQDLFRLSNGRPVNSTVILNGLNGGYRVLEGSECKRRLKTLHGFDLTTPYILNVGSSLRRKNRDGILRIFRRIQAHWQGNLVFAGAPLTPELADMIEQLNLAPRVIQVIGPNHEQLEALYNGAFAMIFPSRFEGFGWPVIEAQACGCPVLCSNRCSMPEVAGNSALIRAVEDEAGFSEDLLRLTDPAERERWILRGLKNVRRFSTEEMLDNYEEVYQHVTQTMSVGAAGAAS
jgi:glycosyltransferase involved in cell wall biosynthesis